MPNYQVGLTIHTSSIDDVSDFVKSAIATGNLVEFAICEIKEEKS